MAKGIRKALERPRLSVQVQHLLAGLSGPRQPALLSAAIALAVLLPVWWVALRWYEDEVVLRDQRVYAAQQLLPYAYWLTEDFHERGAILMALKTYLALGPPMETLESDLGALGIELLAHMEEYIEGFQSLWIAPGGVVRYVYPPTADHEVLGRNLMQDQRPGVREDIERAMHSGRFTLSDQDDLGLDRPAWVVWLAVDYGGEYWGLVATWLDPAHIMPEPGTDAPTNWLQLALRDGAGRVRYGPASVFEAEPVIQTVQVPSERWELAAVPQEGWRVSIRGRLLPFEVGGLVIVMLVAGMAYLISSRQAQLATTVKQRTLEISRINRRLREDIARREELEVERERLLEQLGQREAERERLLEQLEQRVAERTHHLKALYDVTAVANASLDLPIILERSLDRIVAAVDSDVGVIRLYEPREGGLRVVAPRDLLYEPCSQMVPLPKKGGPNGHYCWICGNDRRRVVANPATDGGASPLFSRFGPRTHVGVPIRRKGQPTGVLCLFRQLDRPYDAEESTLLAALAEQLGVAVENVSLLAAAQQAATLAERQRLAGELHDSVTQLIYGDMLMAEAGRQTMASGDLAAADGCLEGIAESAQQALKEMRLLLYELQPSQLAQEGLVAALRRRLNAVEKRAGLAARLLVDGTVDLPSSLEEGLYRVAHEALNNALKHASATSVTVELRADGDLVEMRVSDDGRGFDPDSDAEREGLGLTTMRERVQRLGGALVVESMPGAGAVVQVRLPFVHDPASARSYPRAGNLAAEQEVAR